MWLTLMSYLVSWRHEVAYSYAATKQIQKFSWIKWKCAFTFQLFYQIRHNRLQFIPISFPVKFKVEYYVKNVGSKPVENATEKTVRHNGSKSCVYRLSVVMSKPKSGCFSYRLSVVIGPDIKSNSIKKNSCTRIELLNLLSVARRSNHYTIWTC